VGVGGDPSTVFDREGPAVVVEEAVVESAEHRPVGGAGGAAAVAVVEVVDVAVAGWASAAGEDAAFVAGGDGASLLAGPLFGGVVGIEQGAFAVEEHGGEGGVAEELVGGGAGEVPAIAAQDEVFEVVEVAQVGQGAQVDVDVDAGGGAGACPSPGPAAAVPFGLAEPAADRHERVELVVVLLLGLAYAVRKGALTWH